MISILLLLILAWSFYIGYRRGIILQAYYLVATIVSAYFASKYYQPLGQKFNLLIPYANPQEGQGTFFFPSNQLFHLDKVFLCRCRLPLGLYDFLLHRPFAWSFSKPSTK